MLTSSGALSAFSGGRHARGRVPMPCWSVRSLVRNDTRCTAVATAGGGSGGPKHPGVSVTAGDSGDGGDEKVNTHGTLPPSLVPACFACLPPLLRSAFMRCIFARSVDLRHGLTADFPLAGPEESPGAGMGRLGFQLGDHPAVSFCMSRRVLLPRATRGARVADCHERPPEGKAGFGASHCRSVNCQVKRRLTKIAADLLVS